MTHCVPYVLVGFLLASPITGLANPTQGNTCAEHAETQLDLNKCGEQDFKTADAELNRVYREILSRYENDSVFLEKLRTSQRHWIKQRDADLALKYPHADEPRYYGSIFPMCYAAFKADLTMRRVVFLKQWLLGVEEGDGCSGSQKIHWQLENPTSN